MDDFQPEPEPDPSVVLHSAVLAVVSPSLLLTEQAKYSPFIVRQIHFTAIEGIATYVHSVSQLNQSLRGVVSKCTCSATDTSYCLRMCLYRALLALLLVYTLNTGADRRCL